MLTLLRHTCNPPASELITRGRTSWVSFSVLHAVRLCRIPQHARLMAQPASIQSFRSVTPMDEHAWHSKSMRRPWSWHWSWALIFMMAYALDMGCVLRLHHDKRPQRADRGSCCHSVIKYPKFSTSLSHRSVIRSFHFGFDMSVRQNSLHNLTTWGIPIAFGCVCVGQKKGIVFGWPNQKQSCCNLRLS